MSQNIYDRSDFFTGYSGLHRSVHGLARAPEWPALRALLPDLTDKRVVDLGCGFGWFARWARENGASHVLGLDLSQNMLARAEAETHDNAIAYRRVDLEEIELPAASFDFAYSSLAFHYIVDFARLMRIVHRALVPEARFVFSIEHPIYMAPALPAWLADAEGRKTWPVNQYATEGPRVTDWLAKGVVKQHRTMATTLNTLIASGFTIRHVGEWSPSPEQITARPDLSDELERPMLLLIAAQR